MDPYYKQEDSSSSEENAFAYYSNGHNKQKTPNGQYVLTKTPHGKLGNTALPEDWKSLDHTYKELDAQFDNEAPEHSVMYTTIPEQFLGRPDLDHPDGHTECIVKGNFKAKVVRSPGFLQRIPKVAPNTFVIKPVSASDPGSGLGAFAGRDIKIGELVLAERPLIIKPSEMGLLSNGNEIPRHYTVAMLNRVLLHEWEKHLKIAVDRMSEESQEALYALANSHTEDGSGIVTGICRTNGFEMNMNDLTGETPKPGSTVTSNIYCAVGKDASRINHSCNPNVAYSFSLPSFSLQFRAKRNMKAGEQFFFSYIDNTLPVAARKEKLEPYDFECTCPACVHATPESDQLRATCSEQVERFHELCERVYLNPKFKLTEAVLVPMLKLRQRMRKEGMESTDTYVISSTVLYRVYVTLGLWEKAAAVNAEIEAWQPLLD